MFFPLFKIPRTIDFTGLFGIHFRKNQMLPWQTNKIRIISILLLFYLGFSLIYLGFQPFFVPLPFRPLFPVFRHFSAYFGLFLPSIGLKIGLKSVSKLQFRPIATSPVFMRLPAVFRHISAFQMV